MNRLLIFALLVGATPAHAADRSFSVTDFNRVRIEGPFDVRLATRGSPNARATGQAAALDVRVEGDTLIVRAAPDAMAEKGAFEAPILYLRTVDLHDASVIGGGKLVISGPVRGARVALQISGSGSIAAPGLDAEQISATVIGTGSMALGGRGAQVRLLSSGEGSIDATALQADALVLRSDGSGEMHASARYTADVATSGLGAATVYGRAKCKVKATAGGPIVCGVVAPEN